MMAGGCMMGSQGVPSPDCPDQITGSMELHGAVHHGLTVAGM
jgi:hypothetical protein